MCSTLKCYFEGRKELFEGLKMMELETEWVKRPVIYFSMSLGGSSAQTLTEYLNNVLSSYEKIYGRNPDEQSLGNRLNGIIQRAYEQAGVQIAIIVDEYDVPLQHTYETNHHDACREIYRNFFTGLKDYGYCIKCVFITGITKFTQISLFSMLNTLTNVSFRNEYATICGLTKDEIQFYFSEQLSELADNYAITKSALMDTMSSIYDGYHFSRSLFYFSEQLSELADNYAITKSALMDTMSSIYDGYHFSRSLVGVYNPFSVCNALANLRLNSYWIASGSNEMLLKVLRKFINEIPELDNCLIDSDYLEMSDVNMNDPKLFLYQSGYLTIKKVVGSSYMLGYPNREVRNAMFGMILPIMLHKESSQVSNAIQELQNSSFISPVILQSKR